MAPRREVILAACLLIAPGWIGTLQAAKIGGRLARALEASRDGEHLPVLLCFEARRPDVPASLLASPRPGAALVEALRRRGRTAAEGLRKELRRLGARRIHRLWIRHALSAQVPVDAIPRLAAWPGLAAIRLDRSLSLSSPAPSSPANPTWPHLLSRNVALWNLGLDGTDMVVGVVDTGVDADHPAIRDRFRGGANSWFDPHGQRSTPCDLDGHGTQVLGCILAGTSEGIPVGVAPRARWIAARLYDDAGGTTFSAIHLCLQWMLDPDGDPGTDDAPHVLNLSWGLRDHPGEWIPEFDEDLDHLRSAGIAVFAAAGNEGPDPNSDLSPANGPSTFSVGAADMASRLALFSSRGPVLSTTAAYPDLVAPGVGIVSTDLSNGGTVESFVTVTGSSFAVAHVSGIALLLRQAFPEASVQLVEEALRHGAVDLGAWGPEDGTGWGMADGLGSLAYLWRRAGLPGDATPPLGDLDENWTVDWKDAARFSLRFGDVTTGPPAGSEGPDLDGDGTVAWPDFLLLLSAIESDLAASPLAPH